jgi:UDP-N-acetylglucosamine 3-dehydrogenase
MVNKIPKILLLGAGRFGIQHLRVLLSLEKENLVNLLGVVVKTKKEEEEVKKSFICKTFVGLENSPYKDVNAVDIVTPASTHFSLVKKCLEFTNVFVEKPLTLNSYKARQLVNIAKKKNRILLVGHIFRFNPAVLKIKELVENNLDKLYFIEGKYTGISRPNEDCGAIFTYLHLFDILDYLLGKKPKSICTRVSNPVKSKGKFEDEAKILLTYDNHLTAFLHLGWVGLKKTRNLNLFFKDMEIFCDLSTPRIEIKRLDGKNKILDFKTEEPLKIELKNFLNTLISKQKPYPDGKIGLRIVEIAEMVVKSAVINKITYLK